MDINEKTLENLDIYYLLLQQKQPTVVYLDDNSDDYSLLRTLRNKDLEEHK